MLKNEKLRNFVAVIILFVVVVFYQALKKDNPKIVRSLYNRLISDSIEGKIIKTVYSERQDVFKAKVYNSESRIKYTVEDWLIDNPQNKIFENDSISKKARSLEYIIYRRKGGSVDTILLKGDYKHLKLRK